MWAFDATSKVLSSSCPSTDQAISCPTDFQPGSLVVFSGRYSLHRVTPVLPGPNPRVNAIFTFEKEAGATLNEYTLWKFFGRSEADQKTAAKRACL